MKYTPEITKELVALYQSGTDPSALASKYEVPRRSIIAKLASLGVYVKKEYTDKQGNTPIKKSEYIQKIADHLDTDVELLESLEKANKHVLKLIDAALAGE